jgi:hypothetical protein
MIKYRPAAKAKTSPKGALSKLFSQFKIFEGFKLPASKIFLEKTTVFQSNM